MPLDLYRDELLPEPTSRKSDDGFWGWLSLALIVCLSALVLVLFIQRGDRGGDGGDDVTPPAVSGLHVLIVEETAERASLPPSQVAIFTSIPLREWYDANCAKEGGQVAYRCFDQHDKLAKETQVWRDLRDKVTLDPPAYLVVNGKRAEQGKLPQDPESFQAVLEKFKGK